MRKKIGSFRHLSCLLIVDKQMSFFLAIDFGIFLQPYQIGGVALNIANKKLLAVQ
jgi:hypothetical protein